MGIIGTIFKSRHCDAHVYVCVTLLPKYLKKYLTNQLKFWSLHFETEMKWLDFENNRPGVSMVRVSVGGPKFWPNDKR